jgi:hypothetical protein
MKVIPPISNIVIDIGNGCSCDDLLSLIKMLLIQLDGISFIISPDVNLEIYFDFSGISNANIDPSLLDCIATHLNHTVLNKINIIIRPDLFNAQILNFIFEKDFKLKMQLNASNDGMIQFNANRGNRFIDINYLISDDSDLGHIYQKFNKCNLGSIDFILSDKSDMNSFTNKLIRLAGSYFTNDSELPILSINLLVENYLKTKLAKEIVFRNASLVILISGDLSKAENYLYSRNQSYFLKNRNIYREKLINIFLAKEYFQAFSSSSLNRLGNEAANAINEFIEGSKDGHCDQEYKCPLVLFYRCYGEYIDNFIRNT